MVELESGCEDFFPTHGCALPISCVFLSLASSATLLGLCRHFPSISRTPGWLIMRSAVCEVAESLFCLVLLSFHMQRSSRLWFVRAMTLCEITSSTLRSFIYFYIATIFRNPFQPERHRNKAEVFVVSFAVFGMVVLLFPTGVKGSVRATFRWGLLYIPFGIFCVAGGTMLAVVQILVLLLSRSAEDQAISVLARQRISRHGKAYFVLYGVQLAAPLLEGFIDPYIDPFYAVFMMFCLRPTISLIGWIGINDLVYKISGHFSIKNRSGTTLLDPEMQTPTPSLAPASLALLRERNLLRGRDGDHFGVRERGFKEELRFELLFDVVRGLGALAHEELRGAAFAADGVAEGARAAARGESQAEDACGHRKVLVDRSPVGASGLDLKSKDHASKGFSIELADANHQQRRTRHAGDEQAEGSASRAAPPPPCGAGGGAGGVAEGGFGRRGADRRGSDSSNSSGHRPSASINLNGPQGDGRRFRQTRHYHPATFARIRAACGVSPAAYAAAFPSVLEEERAADWRDKFKESVSEGASGCFFYRVVGGGSLAPHSRFIVKQITQEEKATLMQILPAYAQHVKARRGRSLIQYFGCHAMQLSWTWSRRVYFVVMRNILPAAPWLVFDLKGATAFRRVLAETRFVSSSDVINTYQTLRDWEWLDIAMSVDISATDKLELAEIITADARFLCGQGLLDYSLLLGVHRLPSGLPPAERQAYVEKMQKAGGYISLDRQKIYFFGIIDVLEKYTLRWKIRHTALTFLYRTFCLPGGAGISAMPPPLYADRFRTFVNTEVLQSHKTRASEFFVQPFYSAGSEGAGEGQTVEDIPSGTGESEKWSPLWKRRQRGLVRERIEAETADHVLRMEELERQSEQYLRLIEELRTELAKFQQAGAVGLGC